jgi:hypothetical protein
MCGIIWCYTGPLKSGPKMFKPIRAFKTPALDMVGPIPHPVMQSMFDPLYPPGDQWYWKARSLVRAPLPVREFAKAMGLSRSQAEQFVAVASACERNRDRLFDARYHMFLRAADSVFITLGSSRKLFLTRKPMHQEADGSEYCVFEIAACSACHAIYLTGKDEDGYLRQTSLASGGGSAMYLLGSDISDTDDDHPLEEENITTTKYMVCAHCGHLRKADSVNGEYCEHGQIGIERATAEGSAFPTPRATGCPHLAPDFGR